MNFAVAPLANRLGIWQLKWELEDMAFRFLEPQTYHHIARQVDETRLAREHYVEQVRRQLLGKVGPTVDLSAGNEQQVTFRQGHDVHERHAVLVLPDEATGNLTLNNLGKNRAHNILLHAPSSARLKLNGQACASTSMLSPGFRCFSSVPYFAPKFVTRPSIMPVPFWLIMPL